MLSISSYLSLSNHFASGQIGREAIKSVKKDMSRIFEDNISNEKDSHKREVLKEVYKLENDTFDKMYKEACHTGRPLEDYEIEPALMFLEKALKETEVKVNLLGSRYITSSSNKDWASLDKVTSTANKVFGEFRKTWNFSNETRKRIKVLEEKIDAFYKKSDELLSKVNIVTKILNWLREFSFIPYTNRFYWDENTRLSSHYSKEQWKKAFHFWDRPKDLTMVSHQPDVYYHQ